MPLLTLFSALCRPAISIGLKSIVLWDPGGQRHALLSERHSSPSRKTHQTQNPAALRLSRGQVVTCTLATLWNNNVTSQGGVVSRQSQSVNYVSATPIITTTIEEPHIWSRQPFRWTLMIHQEPEYYYYYYYYYCLFIWVQAFGPKPKVIYHTIMCYINVHLSCFIAWWRFKSQLDQTFRVFHCNPG